MIKTSPSKALEFDQNFYLKKQYEGLDLDLDQLHEFQNLRLAAVICRESKENDYVVELSQTYICRYVTIVSLCKFDQTVENHFDIDFPNITFYGTKVHTV